MSSQHRIEIYSTPTSPDCLALKRWLNSKNVPFAEHDLRDLAVTEAKNRAGVRITPITVIDDKHIFFGIFPDQRPRIEAVFAGQADGASE